VWLNQNGGGPRVQAALAPSPINCNPDPDRVAGTIGSVMSTPEPRYCGSRNSLACSAPCRRLTTPIPRAGRLVTLYIRAHAARVRQSHRFPPKRCTRPRQKDGRAGSSSSTRHGGGPESGCAAPEDKFVVFGLGGRLAFSSFHPLHWEWF
jgi:hypothetical protein